MPYGYKRDESTPIGSKKSTKLVIDEETAPVVREIYNLCASGLGPKYIANILGERKILKPSMYNYEKTGKYGADTDVTDPYGWNDRTVVNAEEMLWMKSISIAVFCIVQIANKSFTLSEVKRSSPKHSISSAADTENTKAKNNALHILYERLFWTK